VFFILNSPFTIDLFQLNADPPKLVILLQLRNGPQMWKSTRKATNCISASPDMLFPFPFSPTASASSAVKTPDQQSPGPSASQL